MGSVVEHGHGTGGAWHGVGDGRNSAMGSRKGRSSPMGIGTWTGGAGPWDGGEQK